MISNDQTRRIALDRRSVRQVAGAYGVSPASVQRIRNRLKSGELELDIPIPAVNSYTGGIDAAHFLRSIGAAGAVITSPPYNRRNRAGGKPQHGNSFKRQLLSEGFDGFADNLPWTQYIEGQREMLTAALELVGGKDGAGLVAYQFEYGVDDGLEHFPADKILDGFPVRQRVVWEVPGTGGNPGGKEPTYLPTNARYIALITGKHWRVPIRYRRDKPLTSSVWRIFPDISMQHPAAFPVELAIAMCKLAPEAAAVVDPYAGSGTVGIAAVRLGKPFYLGDLSVNYGRIFAERLAQETRPLPA